MFNMHVCIIFFFLIFTAHVTLSLNQNTINLGCSLSNSCSLNLRLILLPALFLVKNIILVLSVENLNPHLYDHFSTFVTAPHNFFTTN